MGTIYTYSRILTGDDETQNRLNVMKDMQIQEENIYMDYPTKEKRKRVEYNKLSKLLNEGDLLYIGNFVSFGDGNEEVAEQWRFLTKTKKVDIAVIDMPEMDTRKGNSGYGPLVSDVVFTMFEYVADKDNNVRKMRQKEGIVLAKERAIVFGRQEKAAQEFNKAYNQWRNKEISAQVTTDMCGLQVSTFCRRTRKMKG